MSCAKCGFWVARAISRWNWKLGARAVAALAQCGAQRLQGRPQRRQVFRGAAHRGQRGAFGLHADAQFQHPDHVLQGCRIEAESRALTLPEDEGADPVAGLQDTGRLQPRDGLAHHRPADAELQHDGALGRQLAAGRPAAVAHAVPQRLDQVGGEGARSAQGSGLHGRIMSYDV